MVSARLVRLGSAGQRRPPAKIEPMGSDWSLQVAVDQRRILRDEFGFFMDCLLQFIRFPDKVWGNFGFPRWPVRAIPTT
jgi:hypothetical protein